MKTSKIQLSNLKKLSFLFLVTLTILSCEKEDVVKEDPIKGNQTDNSRPCSTVGTSFQTLYANLVATTGHQNVVTYDSEVHSYTFKLAVAKKVCKIGYQSQPAIATVLYKMEIYNNTTSTLVYSGNHVFSDLATSYVTIPTIILNASDSYTIKRIQTSWGTNIGNTIGRLVKKNGANVSFPQIVGDLNITGSSFYQNASTQTDWAIPYIDIVFE